MARWHTCRMCTRKTQKRADYSDGDETLCKVCEAAGAKPMKRARKSNPKAGKKKGAKKR